MTLSPKIKTYSVTFIAIALFGLVKLPFQNHILTQEHKANLLTETTYLGVEDQLEQQLALVTLGGLRSLVAAMLSVDAFEQFMSNNWTYLEKRYKQMTSLVPNNNYYWETGAWHMAYNASSQVKSDPNLTPIEQKEGFLQWIKKGRHFMQKSIEKNPDVWILQSKYGDMLSDIYRHPDFEKAAQAYHAAVELGAPELTQRKEFYALARVPSQSREALTLGLKLFKDPTNHVPSVTCNIFALENKLDIPEKDRIPFNVLFPDKEQAIAQLTNQLYGNMRFPTNGVRAKLDELEKEAKLNEQKMIPSQIKRLLPTNETKQPQK